MSYDVFLSYSRKDSEMMRRVRDDLRAAGLQVWTDESLEPGTEVWELEIEKAIRDAHTLVVLLSPDSHASEWVRNEITLADAINRRIFPILLRGEQGESVPLRLIASQWIDARTDYPRAIAQLTGTIKSHIARSNAAVTKLSHPKMQHSHAAMEEDTAPPTTKHVRSGGVRIPLSVGVGATLIMFAVVAIAVILASSTPPAPTPTSTSAPTSSLVPETSTPTPTAEATLAAVVPSAPHGQIAFVSDRASDLYDIYMLNLDRHTTQLLWQNPYTEAYVAWSPDGDWLTFSSWTAPDYKGDIYNLRVDNIRLVNLTDSTFEERYARWSPDATQLVFEAQHDDAADDLDIWTMNADGSDQTDITNSAAWDSEPAWSPDGERIAFTSNREDISQIWTMNPDGSELLNLTPESAHHGHAAWSPDGTHIAYSRCVAPAGCNYEEFAGTDDNWDIWVMDADGSSNVQLTDNPTSDLAPTWSPDGTHIAFVSYRDGNAEIYVMNADGSEQTNVSNNSAADFGPAWRP